MAKESKLEVDEKGFEEAFAKHQEISRAGAEKKFGGHGLMVQTGELKASDEEELKGYPFAYCYAFTAGGFAASFGGACRQKGSDITGERLRFDFSHPKK